MGWTRTTVNGNQSKWPTVFNIYQSKAWDHLIRAMASFAQVLALVPLLKFSGAILPPAHSPGHCLGAPWMFQYEYLNLFIDVPSTRKEKNSLLPLPFKIFASNCLRCPLVIVLVPFWNYSIEMFQFPHRGALYQAEKCLALSNCPIPSMAYQDGKSHSWESFFSE